MGLIEGAIERTAESAITAVAPPAGALVHIALWLRKHWQTIVVVLVIGALAALIWRAPWAESRGFHSRDAEVGALKQQYAELKAADAKAQADAVANAFRIEHAQDQVKEAQANETQDLLTRARADAARYAERLRTQAAGTAQGNGEQSAASEGGRSAGGAAGAGSMPVMDAGDLQICTENTVKAIGWQAYWAKLKTIPR
jgi:hypothetical protein